MIWTLSPLINRDNICHYSLPICTRGMERGFVICTLKDQKMSSLRSNHDHFHLGWKKYLHLLNPSYNNFGSQDWIHCTNLSSLGEGSFFLEGNLRPASPHFLWDVLCWVLIISCYLIYLPHNVAWLWTWARQSTFIVMCCDSHILWWRSMLHSAF